MWATVACLSALSLAPAQAGGLSLKNERLTYGFLGNTRPDAKVLPGDIFIVAFDIEGLKVAEDGKVLYSMGMELTNKDNKLLFKEEPQPLEAFVSLGGGRLPAWARAEIRTDQPAGEYTLKVTVSDRAAKTNQTLTRKFEVLPKKFGLVRFNVTHDSGGQLPAPAIGVAGQSVWVHFMALGFDRDPKTKQPNLSVTMRVLDERGNPTTGKPLTGQVPEPGTTVPETHTLIPLQFFLALNRAGTFNVEVKAVDQLSKKEAVQLYKIRVEEPK